MTNPAPQRLYHLTLTSGSARTSPRREVDDTVVSLVRAVLAGSGELWGGWSVRLSPSGMDRCWIYDLLHHGRRLVACYLCASREHSQAMWAMVSDIPVMPGIILHEPSFRPWLACAIVPDPALLADMASLARLMGEAGDLERCAAWALLE